MDKSKAFVGVILIVIGLLLPRIVAIFPLETAPPSTISFRAVDANSVEISDAKLYKIVPIVISPYTEEVYVGYLPMTLGVEEVFNGSVGLVVKWRSENATYKPPLSRLGETITYNFTGTISNIQDHQNPINYNWMIYAQLIMIVIGFAVVAWPRKTRNTRGLVSSTIL